MVSSQNFSNNLKNPTRQTNDKRTFSIFSIIRLIVGVLLIVGTCLGIGFTIPRMVSNFESQEDFTHSYDFRFKLDIKNNEYAADNCLQKIQKTSDTLSNYLKQHGVVHYDTKYEFYEDSKEGYLSLNVPNQTIESKLKSDENKKIDSDPFLNFFLNAVDTNKTIVYKW